ncbi:GntR family transcriptional regulator [Mesorhizobium sp. BAC0120]|uniref:GntR family transcriptional regulator n=1 Tax=Mesorhizobium sp. BAC0120 TaxID=3090670 RepID=UPI00298D2632|nr:GntR family transcriptional regulator [Mesorhizobium sp. BAC0120]MDW6020586.1 GntR family transcriptional regulator [Mesorhizobium sp. BAC0120]
MNEPHRTETPFAATDAHFVNAPLRQTLKEALLRRILGGYYDPGERLVELRIAEEFGTSQGPVREALRDLEATGLVTNIPRRGTYVSEVMGEGLREIYTVRGALEEQATRIVTLRGGCDLAVLQREVDLMREAAGNDDVYGIIEHSVKFHRAIMEAAKNRLLLNIWQSLQIETRTTITMLTEGLDLREIAASHQPIVDAIASGDAEKAAQVAREHQDYFERLPVPVRGGQK